MQGDNTYTERSYTRLRKLKLHAYRGTIERNTWVVNKEKRETQDRTSGGYGGARVGAAVNGEDV